MHPNKFNLLLRKLKTHKSAFDKIYKFYFPKIVIHINIKYKDKNLGEDIAQDFFVKLFKIEVAEYIESPNSWVYTIAENIAKNIIAKRNYAIIAPLDECTNQVYDIFEEDLYGEYSEKLKSLDEETRDILILHIWKKYRFKEIAELMHVKDGTIRQKYSRGIKKLKEM